MLMLDRSYVNVQLVILETFAKLVRQKGCIYCGLFDRAKSVLNMMC